MAQVVVSTALCLFALVATKDVCAGAERLAEREEAGNINLLHRLANTSRWAKWSSSPYVCLPHVSEESKQRAIKTKLRLTDVVVITFPKTGTTWLQQTCEQLRTGGDMSFSEITERQPWLEFAWDCGQDLDSDQVAFPRIFKSHQYLSAINTGAKYLSIIRHPEAVLVSWFNFQKAKNRPIFKDCEDANEYVKRDHFDGNNIFGTNIWDYYLELWTARHESSLKVFCYETLLKKQRDYLPSLAHFLGISYNVSTIAKVVKLASKQFMLDHDHQFDDHFIAEKGKELGRGLKVMEMATKVTEGHKNSLNDETRKWLQKKWNEKIARHTGLASYEDMAREITKMNTLDVEQ